MTFRALLVLVLFAFTATATGCRPQACVDAPPMIDGVRQALDEGRMDAASTQLRELADRLADEGGYLEGFSEFSRKLHLQIEKQHDLGSLDDRKRDIAQRRLGPLTQGWLREARAVERRCVETYLL